MIRSILPVLLFIATFASPLWAQRAVRGNGTLESYRPDGELRMWTFVVKDSTIGRLFSTVKGRKMINGVEAHIIEQRLGLDFSRTGGGAPINVEGRQFVADNGTYFGSELQVQTGEVTAKLEIERYGDSLDCKVDQGGRETNLRRQFSLDGFAADLYLLDMQELFLAMRDIKVGDTISDTVFVPQIMQKQHVEATVNMFVDKQVYKGKFDSSFVIVYSQPQRMAFYFTPDKRLVKVEIPDQQIKAYLDIVRQFDVSKEPASGNTVRSIASRLPAFAVYLVIALVSMALFAGSRLKRASLWLAFVVGAVAYLPVLITQMPLQTYLVEHQFIPAIAAGGSPYSWGLFPSLITGVIQELLKVGAILLIAYLIKQSPERLAVTGAVCGAAFGFAEACHLAILAVNLDTFSWQLLQRGFMILYHTASGGLLGFGLTSGPTSRRFVLIFCGMVLFDALLRYLPVFVQQGIVDVWMMYFVIPILAVVLTFAALWRFRQEG